MRFECGSSDVSFKQPGRDIAGIITTLDIDHGAAVAEATGPAEGTRVACRYRPPSSLALPLRW